MILNVFNSFDSSIEGTIPGKSFCDLLILKFKSSGHVQENSSTLPSSDVPINDTLLLYGEKTLILSCSQLLSPTTHNKDANITT